jgi:endonuclease/exonuclease/phosphatase family metal-dependent hydrolase
MGVMSSRTSRRLLAVTAVVLGCLGSGLAHARTARFMQWNVRGGNRYTTGGVPPHRIRLPPLDVKRVAAVIARNRPDVVALDEICRAQFLDLRERLRSRGYRYGSQGSAFWTKPCHAGTAMLADHRLVDIGSRTLVETGGDLAPNAPPLPYGAHWGRLQAAATVIGGASVAFYAWHSQDSLQGTEAAAATDESAIPRQVVLCDCNAQPDGPGFGVVMTPFLHRGFREVDTPGTWPGAQTCCRPFTPRYPTQGAYRGSGGGAFDARFGRKVDYIMVRPWPSGFRVANVFVVPTPRVISDHVPLVADVMF